CEVKFKALYSDYRELCLTLKELSPIISTIPLVETFEKNGTVYAVYKYMEVVSLEQYLKYNDNFIPWSEAKQLFRPIFGTLTLLQEKNILHRSISPETILMDGEKNLYISDFSIASNRTRFSEIPESIPKFYGAPEQYEASGWQGNWTDVFGLSATLFRTITGSVPLDVFELSKGRRCPNPNYINSSIPQNVSDAIIKGMEFDTKTRTQSVYELISELLDCTEGNTAVYNVSDVKINKNTKIENHISEETKPKVPQIIIGIIGVIVAICLLSFGMNYYLFSSGEAEESDSQTQQQADIVHVPLFVNKQINTVIGNVSYDSKFFMSYVYEFNSNVPDGVIYKQEPAVGTPVAKGKKVTIYVSKGVNQLIVPDLVDKTISEAMRILSELGIKYNFEALTENGEEEVDYDKVYMTEPVAGETIDVGNGLVTLYIYNKPEQSSQQQPTDQQQPEE
ncbi:MAG: PASTA domain-containing protein, partial [Oscillospiraceae bacterium]